MQFLSWVFVRFFTLVRKGPEKVVLFFEEMNRWLRHGSFFSLAVVVVVVAGRTWMAEVEGIRWRISWGMDIESALQMTGGREMCTFLLLLLRLLLRLRLLLHWLPHLVSFPLTSCLPRLALHASGGAAEGTWPPRRPPHPKSHTQPASHPVCTTIPRRRMGRNYVARCRRRPRRPVNCWEIKLPKSERAQSSGKLVLISTFLRSKESSQTARGLLLSCTLGSIHSRVITHQQGNQRRMATVTSRWKNLTFFKTTWNFGSNLRVDTCSYPPTTKKLKCFTRCGISLATPPRGHSSLRSSGGR